MFEITLQDIIQKVQFINEIVIFYEEQKELSSLLNFLKNHTNTFNYENNNYLGEYIVSDIAINGKAIQISVHLREE